MEKKELGKIKDTATLLKEPHIRKSFLLQSVEISIWRACEDKCNY